MAPFQSCILSLQHQNPTRAFYKDINILLVSHKQLAWTLIVHYTMGLINMSHYCPQWFPSSRVLKSSDYACRIKRGGHPSVSLRLRQNHRVFDPLVREAMLVGWIANLGISHGARNMGSALNWSMERWQYLVRLHHEKSVDGHGNSQLLPHNIICPTRMCGIAKWLQK